MGATTFLTLAKGEDALRAFRDAVASARHEHGHGGYTGTIGEKDTFVRVEPNPGETPEACAKRLLDDPRFDDKWGPAGCVEVQPGYFLFFGWASE